MFSCSCSAITIYWKVDGIRPGASQREGIESGDEVYLDSGVSQRNLTVLAIEDNNNVTIGCIAIRPDGQTVETEMEMHILLQG